MGLPTNLSEVVDIWELPHLHIYGTDQLDPEQLTFLFLKEKKIQTLFYSLAGVVYFLVHTYIFITPKTLLVKVPQEANWFDVLGELVTEKK